MFPIEAQGLRVVALHPQVDPVFPPQIAADTFVYIYVHIYA
jgi:hypothetical protein